MKKSLVIDLSFYLNAEDLTNTTINWTQFEDQIAKEQGIVGSLNDLNKLSLGHQLIIWISGEKVSLIKTHVPPKQQRFLQQILPNLIEDNVAADIDLLHMSAGHIHQDNTVNVAIIERDYLSALVEQLNQAGLRPDVILPNSLNKPINRDQEDNFLYQLDLSKKMCHLRTERQLSYSFDTFNLELMLPLFMKDYSLPLFVTGDKNTKEPNLLQIKNFLQTNYTLIEQNGSKQSSTLLPEDEVLAINLLQGDFKPQQELQKHWKQWKSIIYLSFFGLILHLSLLVIQTEQLKGDVKQTKAEINRLFKQSLPHEKRIVNPKAQMMQYLAKIQNSSDRQSFLLYLEKISPVFMLFKDIQIANIKYQQSLGQIQLDLKAKQYNSLEQIKTKFEQLEYGVRLGSVSGNSQSYAARITIKQKNIHKVQRRN